jgi:hypothetical protein
MVRIDLKFYQHHQWHSTGEVNKTIKLSVKATEDLAVRTEGYPKTS